MSVESTRIIEGLPSQLTDNRENRNSPIIILFPVILSDDVQSSSTPDIILREQSGDDSQLLVDLD